MKKRIISMLVAVAIAVGASQPTPTINAETALVPLMARTIDDIDKAETISINFAKNETEKVIPVIVEEKGGVLFGVTQNFSNDFLSLTLTLFEDENCTLSCGSSLFLFSDRTSNTGSFAVSTGGTYYLKAILNRQEDNEEVSFSLTSLCLSSEDRKLEERVFSCTFDDSADENLDTCYTIRVKQAGVLAIGVVPLSVEQEGNFYLSLYDEYGNEINSNYALQRDSEISNLLSITGAAGVFAVTKGTYQVRASSIENYAIAYDFIAVKETSGTSKKKAVKLKAGKTAKGIIEETSSIEKCDWYKIVLPKKSKFVLQLSSITNSNLEFQIVDSKGNIVDGSVAELQTTGYKISTKGKWKKGTYYLSVRKTGIGSGFYSIKLKR